MLKKVLSLVCVLALVVSPASALKAKGKKGSYLFELQEQMIEMLEEYFTSSGTLVMPYAVGVNMAETDFCKITSESASQRESKSLFFGQQCKDSFVDLYDEEGQCSGVFCNVVTMVKDEAYDVIVEIIEAASDDEAFGVMKDRLFVPAMDWMCRCSMPLMDKWMECKDGIGEAGIFDMLQISGGFDTTADYLGGDSFKDFWVDMIANRINWDNIERMMERVVENMCEDDTQFGGKCYDYYWNAVTNMYQWFLKSTGNTPSPCKGKKCPESITAGYDDSCSMFDFEQFGDDVTFADVEEAVEDKFCVDECSGLYQHVLLGCCSATMIQDTELSDSVMDVAEDFNELWEEVYSEGGTADYMPASASPAYMEESMEFDDIVGYFQDSLDMLRNPTCENGVEYSVVPCDEYVAESDPCEGLSGKKLKKCEKDQESEVEDMDMGARVGDPCEGLSGKKLKKCEKEQKKNDKKGKGKDKGKKGKKNKGDREQM